MALDLSFLKKKYDEMLDAGSDALSSISNRVTSNLSPSTIRQIGTNFSINANKALRDPFPNTVDVTYASKPVQLMAQGISNMGGWKDVFEQGQLKDIPLAFTNPLPKTKLDRVGNSGLKIASEMSKMFQGGYDIASGLGAGDRLMGTGTGAGGNRVARGGVNIIDSAPFYAGATKPLAALAYTGLGAGFGGAISKFQGASDEEALDTAINTGIDYMPKALAMAGITASTQPGMDAILKTKALAGMPGALKTVAKSVLNVIQGRPIDDVVAPNQTDSEKAMSIAIDAVFPILGDMSGWATKQIAGKISGINPAKFASADEAMRAVDARVKKALGMKLRKSDGTITTVGKYIQKTRPYKQTGKYTMGAMFGFEPYQDENGKWSVRFNNTKAAVGLLLMAGGTKAMDYANDAMKQGEPSKLYSDLYVLKQYQDSIEQQLKEANLPEAKVRELMGELDGIKEATAKYGDMMKNAVPDSDSTFKKIQAALVDKSKRGTLQVELEQAVNAKDYKKVGELLDAIPEGDPYKAPMERLFRKLVPTDTSVEGVLKSEKGGANLDELNKIFGIDDARRMEPEIKPGMAPTTSEAQQAGENIEGGMAFFKTLPDDVHSKFKNFVNNRRAASLEGDIAARQFKELDAGGIQEFQKIQSGAKGGIYDKLGQFFDAKYKQLTDAGIDMRYQEDYLPQLWKENEETVREVLGKYMGMSPSFTKEKVIDSYAAGIAAGLHPRFEKISDLVKWYEFTADKALANKQFFDFLLDNKYIIPKSKAPAGFVSLDPDRFKSFRTTVDGKTEFVGTYAASPSIAKVINNYLQPGAGQDVAKAFSKAKTITLSGGVPKTAINAHGANMLARATLSDPNPVRGFFTGLHWMVKPDDAGKYLDKNLEDALPFVKHGMTMSVEDSDVTRLSDAITLGGKVKNLGTRALKLQEDLLEDPLFKKMIPALKVQYAKRTYADLIKSMPEDEALDTAAKIANNMFSGINYDEMMRGKSKQNFLRMLLIAPDWAESNVRVGAGTVKGLVKFGDPHYKAYRIFARNLLAAYITANVLNKATSGKWMNENDKGQQFNIDTGIVDNEGRKVFIKPFGTATDFARLPYEIASGLIANNGDFRPIFRVLTNRLSTPLGAITRIALTNQDYLGRPIHSQDKYGNPMPVGKSVANIGNEALTGIGFPNWGRAVGDLATGKSGFVESAINAFELPIRYSGGATTQKQKMMVDAAQATGKSGKEINTMLKEEKTSKSKTSGMPQNMKAVNDMVKEINRQYMDGEISREEADKAIKSILDKNKTYKKSEDAPQNIIQTVGTYGKAAFTSPGDTAKAILSGQPIRKVVGDAIILERQENLGAEDLGNKATVVDHIIPLELGGTNDASNRRTITEEENKLKMQYENQLQKQLASNEITKKEATQKMLDWVQNRGTSGAVTDQSLPEGVIFDGSNYQYRTTNSAGNRTTVKIPKDFNPEIPKIADTNDLTEFEKEQISNLKGEISSRINQIVKGAAVGIWTREEAESDIAKLKEVYDSLSVKTKNGKSYIGGKSTGKGKKPKVIRIPKMSLRTAKVTKMPTIKFARKTARKKYATRLNVPTVKLTPLKLPTIKLKSMKG